MTTPLHEPCDLCTTGNANSMAGGVTKYVPSHSKIMSICAECLSRTVVWDVASHANQAGDVTC